jgi:large subunit ribosomal protein L13
MTTIMKTFSPKPRDIERRWYVVDADGAVLGRLASEVAKILRGKHKPIFAPHADTGDHVIVVNAKGVRLTGGKEAGKMYYHHSGYPGGLRALNYTRLMSERPARAVEKAIKGMLPKNRLGRQMATKLAVYEGPEHPHQAQKPVPLGLGQIPKWEGLPKPAPKPAPKKAEPKAKGRTRSRAGSSKATASGPKRGRAATGAKAKPLGKPEAAARPKARSRSKTTGDEAPAETSAKAPRARRSKKPKTTEE